MWTRRNKARLIIHFTIFAALTVLSSPLVAAANLKAPSAILNQYRDQRVTWFTAVWPYANTLFGMLAVIEFAWSAAVMLLEKSDLQSWTAALVRKVMWLGTFYALLLYGRFWIPAITDSFEIIGQNAAGTGPMSPSDVFSRDIDLAGALMAASSSAAFLTNLGTSLTMVVTGIITALAFYRQRKSIDRVYAYVASGSQAQTFISDFYRSDPPQKRAQTETVSVEV